MILNILSNLYARFESAYRSRPLIIRRDWDIIGIELRLKWVTRNTIVKNIFGDREMEIQTLKLERSEGIATITLNRPEKRNPLSLQVFKELDFCLDTADADKSIAAVIITGGEKVYS
jgi:hypothetical protein